VCKWLFEYGQLVSIITGLSKFIGSLSVLSSFLIVVAICALIYGFKRWQSLPESDRADFSKKALLYGTAGTVLVLVLAGRAHWLMGVLAALLALAGRVAQFAQYMPLFKQFIGEQPSASQNGSSSPTAQGMTKQDAADILGVDSEASASDIRMAHKRLMQKLHPDRGGSDALAKQINQAKDVLLG